MVSARIFDFMNGKTLAPDQLSVYQSCKVDTQPDDSFEWVCKIISWPRGFVQNVLLFPEHVLASLFTFRCYSPLPCCRLTIAGIWGLLVVILDMGIWLWLYWGLRMLGRFVRWHTGFGSVGDRGRLARCPCIGCSVGGWSGLPGARWLRPLAVVWLLSDWSTSGGIPAFCACPGPLVAGGLAPVWQGWLAPHAAWWANPSAGCGLVLAGLGLLVLYASPWCLARMSACQRTFSWVACCWMLYCAQETARHGRTQDLMLVPSTPTAPSRGWSLGLCLPLSCGYHHRREAVCSREQVCSNLTICFNECRALA